MAAFGVVELPTCGFDFLVKLFVLHLVLVLIDIAKIVIFLFFFSFLDVLGLVGLVGRVGGPLLHIPLLRARLITESEQGAGGSKKRKRGVFFSQKEGRRAGKPL